MNLSKKFNHVINLIEELVKDKYYNSQEIASKVASEYGVQLRDMSSTFRFMTGMTLHTYISGRKLNAAYYYLINPDNGKSSILEAVEISGYSDQPSFTKAFKKKFGITPKEAQKSRDSSKLEPPITWGVLSNDSPSIIIESEEETMNETTVFGVKEEELNRISKILSLEAFYGFPRNLSEYSYALSEHTGHSVDDCFRFVESIREYLTELDDMEKWARASKLFSCEDDERTDKDIEEICLHEIGDNKLFQDVFFDRGISVSFIDTLLQDYHVTKDELMKCDMKMLKAFPPFKAGTYMNFSYYMKAFEYWSEEFDIEETEDAFDNYLDLFFYDFTLEEAFIEVYEDAMEECGRGDELYEDIDPPTMEEISRIKDELSRINDDYTPYFERWAREQESNWNDERIDDDLYYDPENPDLEFDYE